MDKSTQEWLEVINSGRAYSNFQPGDVLKHFKKSAKQHFSKILRRYIIKGDVVLDAGCGPAYNSFYFAYEGINVTALDISEKLIRELLQVKNVLDNHAMSNLELVVGSIFELNKLDKKFNVVFNNGVYEHWLSREDRDRILQNISAVLSEHGKYIVAVPNLKNPLFHAALSDNEVPDMWEFTLSDLENELLENGFNTIETGYMFVAPGFEQWLQSPWMAYPIHLIDNLYPSLPFVFRKLLAAHIYCVAEKQ